MSQTNKMVSISELNPNVTFRNPNAGFALGRDGDDSLRAPNIAKVLNNFTTNVSSVDFRNTVPLLVNPIRQNSQAKDILNATNFYIDGLRPQPTLDPVTLTSIPGTTQEVSDALLHGNPNALGILSASTQFQSELETIGNATPQFAAQSSIPGQPVVNFGINSNALDYLGNTLAFTQGVITNVPYSNQSGTFLKNANDNLVLYPLPQIQPAYASYSGPNNYPQFAPNTGVNVVPGQVPYPQPNGTGLLQFPTFPDTSASSLSTNTTAGANMQFAQSQPLVTAFGPAGTTVQAQSGISVFSPTQTAVESSLAYPDLYVLFHDTAQAPNTQAPEPVSDQAGLNQFNVNAFGLPVGATFSDIGVGNAENTLLGVNVLQLPDVIPVSSSEGLQSLVGQFSTMDAGSQSQLRTQFANPTTLNTNVFSQTAMQTTGGGFGKGTAVNPFLQANFLQTANASARLSGGVVIPNGNGNGVALGSNAKDLIFGTANTINFLDGSSGEDTVDARTASQALVNVHAGDVVTLSGGNDTAYMDMTRFNPSSRDTTVNGGNGQDTVVCAVADPVNGLPQFQRDANGLVLVYNGQRVHLNNIEQIVFTDRNGNIANVVRP